MKTRKTKIYLAFIFSALFFMACEEEEVALEREYPRVNTLEVTNINSNGATFNADFIYRGDFEITRYGFVWSDLESTTFLQANKLSYQETLMKDQYSVEVKDDLVKNQVYYVRAFVETKEFRVFGNQVSFTALGSAGTQ